MFKYLFLIVLTVSSLISNNSIINFSYAPERIVMNDVNVYSKDFGVAVGNYGMVRIIRDSATSIDYIYINDMCNLKSVVFLNSKELVCVGNSGKVFISRDSALTWLKFNSITDEDLNSVAVIDDKNFIAVGNNGTIIKTTNSGYNWEKIETEFKENLKHIAVSKDKKIIYIAGNNGTLLKSINKGYDWEKLSVNTSINFNRVIADIDDKLYVNGDSLTVLISDNQGKTFDKHYVSKRNLSFFINPITKLFMFKNGKGILKVRDNAQFYAYDYYTFDGGITWIEQRYNRYAYPWGSVYFDLCDENFGYLTDENGNDYRLEFKEEKLYHYRINNLFSYSFRGISANSNNILGGIYEYGSPIELVLSTNSGNSWTINTDVDTIGQDLGDTGGEDIAILSNNNILLSMNYEVDSSYTNNSGNTTWVMKFHGYVLKSTDLGKSWSSFYVPNKEKAEDIKMYNDNHGVLLLANGTYMVTHDGGSTWEYVQYDYKDEYRMYDVICKAYSNQLILARDSDKSFLMQTYDDGNTWEEPVELPDRTYLYRYKNGKEIICTYDYYDDNQYECSLLGKYQEADSWVELYHSEKDYYSYIGDILLMDDDSMIALHANGSILYTDNFWDDYITIELPALDIYEEPRHIVEIREKEFFISTNDDKIFKLIIDDETNVNFDEIKKSDISVYPNPVSDIINISFNSLLQKQNVDIEFFNLQGEKIFQSTNLCFSGNMFELKLSNNIQTGTYFIKITNKNSIYFKKIMVVK